MKEEIGFIKKQALGFPLKLYVNGISLSDEIEGFELLNVFGRTTAQKKVEVQEGNADGGFLVSNKYSTRKLTIQYWIKADTNKQFIESFEKLNKLLRGDVLDIMVNDEKFHYYGVLFSIEEIDDTTNWQNASFEIICSDPYKYSDEYRLKFERKTNFPYSFLYDVIPDSISLTINGSCETIKVTNVKNGKAIILNGRFSAEDNILIDIKNNNVVYNRQNNLHILNLLSDFEDFSMNYNDEIVVTGSASDSCEVIFRERRL